MDVVALRRRDSRVLASWTLDMLGEIEPFDDGMDVRGADRIAKRNGLLLRDVFCETIRAMHDLETGNDNATDDIKLIFTSGRLYGLIAGTQRQNMA